MRKSSQTYPMFILELLLELLIFNVKGLRNVENVNNLIWL